jgi:hypothetical protein
MGRVSDIHTEIQKRMGFSVGKCGIFSLENHYLRHGIGVLDALKKNKVSGIEDYVVFWFDNCGMFYDFMIL